MADFQMRIKGMRDRLDGSTGLSSSASPEWTTRNLAKLEQMEIYFSKKDEECIDLAKSIGDPTTPPHMRRVLSLSKRIEELNKEDMLRMFESELRTMFRVFVGIDAEDSL
jgi:hypothetical protein